MTEIERCWIGKMGPIFFKALNAMLQILAFHLKALRSHLSRREKTINWWQERPRRNHGKAKTMSLIYVNHLTHPLIYFWAHLIQALKPREY